MSWRDLTVVVWCALAAMVVACQVVAVRFDGAWPRVDDALRAACTTRAGRTIVLLGWMWLGWHLFAR